MIKGQAHDHAFLRSSKRPSFREGSAEVNTVDLYSGCGGMTLGIAQAAHSSGLTHRIPFAIDIENPAVDVFKDNFPGSGCIRDDIREWFAPNLGDSLTNREREVREKVGSSLDFLVGGPPCQGNSNLNNHTRRRDPRNALYAKMARAAHVLEPEYVIIENVPAVLYDQGGVVKATKEALESQDYKVHDTVLNLWHMGLPQMRRRHVLLASANEVFDPYDVLEGLNEKPSEDTRDVAWAIGDLEGMSEATGFDAPSKPSSDNARRMRYLFENHEYDLPNDERPPCHRDKSHSYNSVYGRLRWDQPAPTITTGFNSMGQGRYVHPSRCRTITPHEAARLQFIPDFFDFGAVHTRSGWAKLIGNAVPPLLTMRIAESALSVRERNPGVDKELGEQAIMTG